jgi:hypothetical protein
MHADTNGRLLAQRTVGELAAADESEAAGTSGVSLKDGLLKRLHRAKFSFGMEETAWKE